MGDFIHFSTIIAFIDRQKKEIEQKWTLNSYKLAYVHRGIKREIVILELINRQLSLFYAKNE